MEEERKSMGWSQNDSLPFIRNVYKSEKDFRECLSLINDADIVIKGDGAYSLISERLKKSKLTFIYSERVYKNNKEKRKIPYHYFKFGKWYRGYENLYLLCASAFASADYKILRCFIDKAFKWGYYTEVRKYESLETLLQKKESQNQGIAILWAARLIDLKHPEYSVMAAKKLKDEGLKFTLNIIGSGKKEESVKMLIKELDLSDCVRMLGSMSPDAVRDQMEASDIFLFTSDQNEGWGAVLNESMNSACAVVASHTIGSVPFLIEDRVNGLIYRDGDVDDLYNKIRWLIDNEDERIKISRRAYHTIVEQWNADNAAKRLLSLASSLQENLDTPYESGVCSKAAILKDNWYK